MSQKTFPPQSTLHTTFVYFLAFSELLVQTVFLIFFITNFFHLSAVDKIIISIWSNIMHYLISFHTTYNTFTHWTDKHIFTYKYAVPTEIKTR